MIQNAQVTAPRQGSKRKKCGIMGWSGQYFTDLNTKYPAAQGVLREFCTPMLQTSGQLHKTEALILKRAFKE